jgi:hypothetical protein
VCKNIAAHMCFRVNIRKQNYIQMS